MRIGAIASRIAALSALAGTLAVLAPASASAAPCAGGTTKWTGGAADNSFLTESNWDNGGPSAACDATIASATAPVILAGSASVKKLTIAAGQTLEMRDVSIPTLTAVTVQNDGTIQLDCPEPKSCGVPQPNITVTGAAADAFANAGTVISAGSGEKSEVNNLLKGNVTNTGSFQINDFLRWESAVASAATFTNRGTVSLATTCTSGVCMYSPSSGFANNFFNDVGGNITNNGGSKYLQVDSGSFTQGAGNTSTGNAQSAVVMRGNLVMTGAASTAEISGYGAGQGINVSGTVGAGQTIKMPGGTLTVTAGTLINQGTIRATGSSTSLVGNITTAGSGLLDVNVLTSHSGGTLDATGGNILIGLGSQLNVGTLMNHGGQITGQGTINGNVNNVSGILNPANGIGSMPITGSYTQGAGATLAIEAQGVAGPQHDSLQVGGNVNLDGTLRIVPELGYVSPSVGDALKVIGFSGTRSGAFSASLADPPFTEANIVNVGYDDAARSVYAFVGTPTLVPGPTGSGSPGTTGRAGLGPLFGSPLYRAILDSLEPNGSFRLTRTPVVFPGGQLGLEVDTGGSCRLTAVEQAVPLAKAGASAAKKTKVKKRPKGLIKKVTVYANGSGRHVLPLNLTAKGKRLLKKRKGKGRAHASAAAVLKDPLVITCTPIVYPVANFPDKTQITGIGKAPVGNPPAGQPAIPSSPPVVQPGGVTVTQKPVVSLPQLPAQPPSIPEKRYKATVDLDATVGASVGFTSNGKVVRAFDASFRVVCGFPFPSAAPLVTVHFDTIPAISLLNGGSAVVQGSFELARQTGTGSSPTWDTVSVQGDNANGYTVRVYERSEGCQGGTVFSARPSA